jgi:hypothetical protein
MQINIVKYMKIKGKYEASEVKKIIIIIIIWEKMRDQFLLE